MTIDMVKLERGQPLAFLGRKATILGLWMSYNPQVDSPRLLKARG